MCAAKSPISLLQELTVMKHLPFPQYDTISQGSGFKCIGRVGMLSASAIAESKKRAKHLCAEHILQLLESQQTHDSRCTNLTVVVKHLEQVPTHQNPIIQQVFVEVKEPNFNAVGKLNELCAQRGIVYPNYEEVGVVQQKFVIECRLCSHVTLGHASTKKQAKQMAAKEMLSRFSLPDFGNAIAKEHNLEQTKLKPPRDAEVEEKIIQLFKELSSKTKRHPHEVQANPFSQTRTDLYPNLKAEELKAKVDEQEDEASQEKLKEELERMGVAYRIFEFQRRPLVLVLRTIPIRNHPQYTFMHSANTYDLTLIGLLKKAVRDVKLMQM